MTHDELAKEFHVLNGGHWHEIKSRGRSNFEYPTCSCGERFSWIRQLEDHIKTRNPTYSTTESVLGVMMKREDVKGFTETLGHIDLDGDFVIKIKYVYPKSDKLLTAAVEWCRQHEEENKNE